MIKFNVPLYKVGEDNKWYTVGIEISKKLRPQVRKHQEIYLFLRSLHFWGTTHAESRIPTRVLSCPCEAPTGYLSAEVLRRPRALWPDGHSDSVFAFPPRRSLFICLPSPWFRGCRVEPGFLNPTRPSCTKFAHKAETPSWPLKNFYHLIFGAVAERRQERKGRLQTRNLSTQLGTQGQRQSKAGTWALEGVFRSPCSTRGGAKCSPSFITTDPQPGGPASAGAGYQWRTGGHREKLVPHTHTHGVSSCNQSHKAHQESF